MKTIRTILTLPLLLILSLSLYTVSYFWIEIKPLIPEMNTKIEIYSQESINKRLTKQIALQQEGKQSIFRYVAHSHAVDNVEGGFRGLWHLIGLHWHLWIYLMFSEDDIFHLWLAQVPSGGPVRGVNEAALYHFNTRFEELTCYEIVQLIVSARSPSLFKPNGHQSENWIKDKNLTESCQTNTVE